LYPYKVQAVRHPARVIKMVTTRGQTAASQNSAATVGSRLVNPTLKVNWPPTPKTKDEFMQWMEANTQALLKWLGESRSLAEDEESRKEVGKFNKSTMEEWKEHKAQTDVQTGSIYNKSAQIKMEGAMDSMKQRRAELHRSLGTWHKYAEYRTAQSAWEDFLYYQNVWNRKFDKWIGVYHETAAEKEEHKAGLKDKEAGANKFIKKNPTLGTEGSEDIQRTDDSPNGWYYYAYDKWIEEIVKIFKTFRLGYRKRAPDVLTTENAHRYTQPPRGTTPTLLRPYRRRHKHLEERFPREKRTVIDPNEIEEARRDRRERQKDNEQARQGNMVPISCSLDEDSFRKVRKIKESAIRETATRQKLPGYASDIRTKKLLLKGHQLHHASIETSFDWPTSFESANWGNALLETSSKITKVYQEVTDTGEDSEYSHNDDTKKRKREQYKLDDSGQKIDRMIIGRYVMEAVKKPGKIFTLRRNNDGTVKGRDSHGKWRGRWVNGEVEEHEFKLDENSQRISETPRPIYRRVFNTSRKTPEDPGMTRQSRHATHEDTEVADQLSDEEDPGRTRKNINYGLSRNANPNQIGEPTIWDDDSELENVSRGEADNVGGEGEARAKEEESDDEGDLFRLSYEECCRKSECPKRRRARKLHTRLVTELGNLPSWNEDNTLEFVDEGLSDEAIHEEYNEQVVAVNAPIDL
jgi:hypothetical protein